MSETSVPFRVGHGYDIHRLQSGGVLMVAGVKVAEGISPVAHSDGDVALHAIVMPAKVFSVAVVEVFVIGDEQEGAIPGRAAAETVTPAAGRHDAG